VEYFDPNRVFFGRQEPYMNFTCLRIAA